MEESGAQLEEVLAILLYGAAGLVIGGGAGIYIPMIQGKDLGVDLFATYAFAILAPAIMDAFFESYWRDQSLLRKMLFGFFCFSAVALAGTSLLRENHPSSMKAAMLAAALVLIIWFFMTLTSGRFRKSPPLPPKGSIGGDNLSTSNLGGGGLPS